MDAAEYAYTILGLRFEQLRSDTIYITLLPAKRIPRHLEYTLIFKFDIFINYTAGRYVPTHWAFILKCEVTIDERSGRTNFREDTVTSYSLFHLCRYESCRSTKKNHDLGTEIDLISSMI